MRRSEGFTIVELLVVVVISTITLAAIYQTLITQERSYRHQSAAISAQGTSRMALQVIASELREISASAGGTADMGGTDLIVATRDSLRLRAFRKVGIVCSVADSLSGTVDVWVPGESFVRGDEILFHEAGIVNRSDDDAWGAAAVSGVGINRDLTCALRWPAYDSMPDYRAQNLQGLGSAAVRRMQPGSMVRSFVTVTYGNYEYDGVHVVGRIQNDSIEALVGPIRAEDGLEFRYFDESNTEITTLDTDAQRSRVARVLLTVRSIGRGGGTSGGDWVDSVSTNVYLRGN